MRILFFAQLKDATGCDAVEITVPSPLDQDALWAVLQKRFPGLGLHRATTRLTRNWEFADLTTCFIDGDEVALIPPVSGG
jgi:molybdopterin converting factor small subunit